ncbi:MAG TPA: 23S rRNA (adenine(2503)-C(2))-methyltransferase RlmN [Methylomirabilota bacterium]|jgi:23S rRNA (adenine2503-C2)-methyltransferase|nr:23S rRNA (adenine(2503)-C(2))-methyltransferase RlmN [Methylomirabilota bacterium]
MSATNLLELAPDELTALVERLEQPAYRARQLASWIYARGVADFGAMTDLPRELRERLQASAVVAAPALAAEQSSRDGSTKLALRLGDGRTVQGVLMPDDGRLTLCVSTQVGCGFGCAFCLTGTMGLVRDLTAGEIVGQVWRARAILPPDRRLTHVVFMGMGEPLANYQATVKALRILTAPAGFGFSPRRITVSTVGLVQGLERLARENLRVNIAVSLHAVTDEVRGRLMPVNRGWGVEDLLAACRRFPLPVRQRMTFEYTLLAGVNDATEDARALARRLRGLRAKVNLIPFNEWPGSGFRRPPLERILGFQRTLLDAGLTATVRWSKGEDVGAACGQLRTADRRGAA